ncbi:MAG: EamA family transporter [Armatimonadota bacterium]|nr:EamA family transporter [Armatimonadota bacterium]
MNLFLLFIAWLFTGITLTLNKALVELGLGSYMYVYMVGFWGTGVAAGVILRYATNHRSTGLDAAIGMSMGVAGALALLTFLVALGRVSGVVAFPVRSCGNVLLTACVSWLIWREELRPTQWLGIALSAVAIYLLV